MTLADECRTAADWAVWSKHPGRAMGYTLLACSGDPWRAERLITAGGAGTPRGELPGRAEELPWYTFLGDLADGPVLGVVKLSWSGDRDGTGQTIMPARLLTVPLPASTGPDMVELYGLAERLEWSGVAGPPAGTPNGAAVAVAPAPLNIARAVQVIEQLTVEWTLGTALALVDGHQVVIVVPPDRSYSVLERVQILDAVCALLPYGCRFWASAATWASDTSAHQVRLTFAASAHPSQYERLLDEAAPPVEPRSPAVAAYAAELRTLLARAIPLASIVSQLAAYREPLWPEELDEAVRYLQDLRLPEVVYEQIRQDTADPAELDRVLRRVGWAGLADGMRREFVRFLVRLGARSPLAQDVLARYWSVEVYAGEVVAALRGGERSLARDAVRAAADVGRAQRDDLVAASLARIGADDDERVVAAAVALLVDTGCLAHAEAPVWGVLARDPRIGGLLLQQVTRAGGERTTVRECYAALAGHQGGPGTEWVAAMGALLAPEDDAVVPALPADTPDDLVLFLLQLAVAEDRPAPYLEVAHRRVLGLAYRSDAGGTRDRLRIVGGLVDRGTVRASWPVLATLDLILLGASGTMPALERGLGDGYLPALHQAWRSLPDEDRRLLAERLPQAILRHDPDPRSFTTLAAVVTGVDPATLRPPAVAELGRFVSHDPPLLLRLGVNAEWAAQLASYAPELAWYPAWFPLHDAARDPGQPAGVLAQHYEWFRQQPTPGPADWAVHALAPRLTAKEPHELAALLLSFASDEGGVLGFAPDSFAREIHDAVAAGQLGPEPAAAWRDHRARLQREAAALRQLGPAPDDSPAATPTPEPAETSEVPMPADPDTASERARPEWPELPGPGRPEPGLLPRLRQWLVRFFGSRP